MENRKNDMNCSDCKFWNILYRKETSGEWNAALAHDGQLIGWCQKTHPTMTQNVDGYEGRAKWPETKANAHCGEYEPKVTQIEQLIKENVRRWHMWLNTVRELRKIKKKHKELIKAIKVKYPKIRLNDKAIEKAIEIITTHKTEQALKG